MDLKVLKSSSAGNCYILDSDDSALIIECGVRFSEVRKALDYKVSKIEGALLTHEHLDHARHAENFMRHGVKVYSGAGTFERLGTNNHNSVKVSARKEFDLGPFRVLPFETVHDVSEPLGYYIYHPQIGNTLFVTDTNKLAMKFAGLNNLIIEANYCGEILDHNILNGWIPQLVRDRVRRSHMSIQKLLCILEQNDLSGVNNIVLIHLSDGNSNARSFEQQVRDLTGKSVVAADKNMTIPINKTPF